MEDCTLSFLDSADQPSARIEPTVDLSRVTSDLRFHPPMPGRLASAAWRIGVLREAGVIAPMRPDRTARVLERFVRLGPSPALLSIIGAIRRADEVAIDDELGSLTFAQTHQRSNALARALRAQGVDAGDGVAILCRNHRYFVEATMACAKLGAVALFLNTGFAKPQLIEVLRREGPVAAIYDEEFADLFDGAPTPLGGFLAWIDSGAVPGTASVEALISAADGERELTPPKGSGRYVILTSGTTGTPKGAQRGAPSGLGPLASFLSKIPYRAGQTNVIAAPLFHSWGFLNLMFGFSLGTRVVLRRQFDPALTLSLIGEHQAAGLVVVPVMLQRILELPQETRALADASSLRVTAVSGSALPGELASRWMDEFGDNLYNLYGSTEVAWASIATPEDMRLAPDTAGRPPRDTAVRIIAPNGRELPAGQTGRIFVGNEMAFDGYTGGGDKERLGGLAASGDVGHFDERGLLFIDGRDDEMIVSGGENVFPREVEDCLVTHEAVLEAAAVGVDDEEFGQRLVAFCVLRDGGLPRDGSGMLEEALREHVKSNLARYKVPREVVFVDRLPRNTTGKVLKRELTVGSSSA